MTVFGDRGNDVYVHRDHRSGPVECYVDGAASRVLAGGAALLLLLTD